jgi:major membrane immunogen (membrane-anchored lipoprotein)
MDIQVFQTALITYFKDQDKDIHKLMKYASEFGIEKMLRQYTEVLL